MAFCLNYVLLLMIFYTGQKQGMTTTKRKQKQKNQRLSEALLTIDQGQGVILLTH